MDPFSNSSWNMESVLFAYLFQLSPSLQAALRNSQYELGLRAHVIAVHLRTNHPDWADGSTHRAAAEALALYRNASLLQTHLVPREVVEDALSCAAEADRCGESA